MFTETFPILSTPDLRRALAFYRDLLGAEVTYQFPAEGDVGYVALDLGTSHLGIGLDPEAGTDGDGQRISLWVYSDDCDAAVDRLRAAGVRVTAEPTDQPWGERIAPGARSGRQRAGDRTAADRVSRSRPVAPSHDPGLVRVDEPGVVLASGGG